VLQNLPAITAWRNRLPEAKRRSFNHPGACWHGWRRSSSATKETAERRQIVHRAGTVMEKARKGKPVYWPQAALRRAHEAMLDSHSTDLLVLARCALQGAIRNEANLLELLDDAPAALSGGGHEMVLETA
jgi:hypothetical protein